MSLRINGTGHVIHAFVNGEHIGNIILYLICSSSFSILFFNYILVMVLGSHWATYGVRSYEFETKIKLMQGKNIISLLSVTVGLQV